MGVVGSPFTEDPDKQIILATCISSTFVLPKSIGDLSLQERSKPKVVYLTKIINLDQFKRDQPIFMEAGDIGMSITLVPKVSLQRYFLVGSKLWFFY